jgi:hypothetical protein
MNTPSIAAPRTTETLKAAIAGQVFVPGDAGYDQGRRAWNLAVGERPAVVVDAGSAADVAQAVRIRPRPRDADRPRPNWSPPAATWSAPTPATSPTCSGPSAAAAASAW